MKRLPLSLVIFLLFSLCWSCKTPDNEWISLNIQNKDFKIFKFDDIFTFEKIIYLEETPNSLISEVVHLKIVNNELYLSDNQHGIVYRFTEDGKFLNTIGKKGRGPGELQSMINFLVTESELIAVDFYKVVRFSLDGKFIKEISKPAGTFDILEQDGNFLVFNSLSSDDDQIIVIDTTFNIKSGFSPLKNDNVIYPMAGRGYMFKDNNNSFITYPFSDTIFKLTDNIAKPYFIFGFNQRKLTNYTTLWGGNFDGDLSMYDYSIKDFITSDYLISSIAHLNKAKFLIYNRNIDELTLIDSLSNGPDLINRSQLCAFTNKGVLYWKYDKITANPTFKSIIDSTSNNNPVLILTSLRPGQIN
jgi:hypothetical protein